MDINVSGLRSMTQASFASLNKGDNEGGYRRDDTYHAIIQTLELY